MPVLPLPFEVEVSDAFGPCEPWEPIWCVTLPTGSEAISGNAVEMATEILWAKTGMRYDRCRIKVRPCRTDCFGGIWPYSGQWWEVGGLYPQPALVNGNWYNLTCGACTGGCSCSVVHEITLPGGPVVSVYEVKVDGNVLPSTGYRLDNWRQLVRLGGEPWPLCNDLNYPDSYPGTWSVTLGYGQPVPVMGRYAVGELAYQIILACMGDECCKLPYNVRQVARQGVTIDYPDVRDLMGVGRDGAAVNRLGLYYCDLFIDAANPAGLRAKSRPYSIDRPNPRITNTGI